MHQKRHAFDSRGSKRPHYNALIKLSYRSSKETAVEYNVNHNAAHLTL